MALLRINLTGAPLRLHADVSGGVVEELGILGVDVSPREIAGENYSVVQLILDDQRPDDEGSLLDSPLVADVVRAGDDPDSAPLARALFDHDDFREKLRREHEAGESVTRGILILNEGELPPPWIRMAFLPIPLKVTAGMSLVVHRSTVDELVSGIETSFAQGLATEDERRSMLVSIEQHHP
ncbi:MAG: hypothetical protein WBF71_05285 [Microthrixaceae bacterium]